MTGCPPDTPGTRHFPQEKQDIDNRMTLAATYIASACKRLVPALFMVLLAAPAWSHSGIGPAKFYNQGVSLYEQSKYAEAKQALEKAVQLAPEESSYYHWLGKAYGRLAENAGPFRAISLSRQALEKLETAVELDSRNIEAMKDLMEFYLQAPGFLGGSREKAEELARRIESLESNEVSGRTMSRMDTPS